MEELRAKESVLNAGRLLLKEGLVARTWGNVSCKISDDSYAITPSGLGYDRMTAADAVLGNLLAGSFSGAQKPSSEWAVHAAAYRKLPDAGFVIHTHQVYATALSLAGFDAQALSSEDSAFLGGAALSAYAPPGTVRLAKNVENAFSGGAHTVLMAHHGAVVAGRDFEEAFARAKRLETVCKAACQGQPEAAGESSPSPALCALLRRANEAFGPVRATAAPAVIAASVHGPVRAQLDDMAQMIGLWLVAAPANEAAVIHALRRHNAVLIRGHGAICRADTEGDLSALLALTEKACVARLHTKVLSVSARLGLFEAMRLRKNYIEDYSKRIGD